jgi:hypothetical protein
VVLNPHDLDPRAKADSLTGACSSGKVPAVLAALDLSRGLDLEKVSPVLDECWRRYMAGRPSNAGNLTFARDRIPSFKAVDEGIRELARRRELLAPGGRRLMDPETRAAPPAGEAPPR